MVLFILIFDNRLPSQEKKLVPISCLRGSYNFDYFDSLKACAEIFVHKISKSAPMMLFESDDAKGCLLSFFGDPLHKFEDSLKNLKQCSPESGGISFPLTNAFTIVNKYRIKNGTDHFGHGRIPWSTEPVHFIIFTNSECQEQINISKTPGTGGDLVAEARRWDHRISVVQLASQTHGGSDSGAPKNLSFTQLTTHSGGFHWQCLHIKDFQDKLESSMEYLLKPALGVYLRTSDKHAGTVCRLVCKESGDWPIPENFWVDNRTDTLAPRPALPTFTLALGAAGKTSNHDIATSAIEFAREHDIGFDKYELSIGASSDDLSATDNVSRILGTAKDEMHLVVVQGSGRHMESIGVQLGDFPFGILRSSSKSTVSELCVLPYNFLMLFQLLKTAIEMRKLEATSARNSMIENFTADFQKYILGMPAYYLPKLQMLVTKLGFPQILRKVEEFKLNKNVLRMILKYQENATSDTIAMEMIAKEKRKSWVQPNPAEIAGASNVGCGQLASWEIPMTVGQIPTSELLSTWERMRRAIFGGGPGYTCRGLSLDHVPPTGSVVPHYIAKQPASLQRINNIFHTALGAKLCPQTNQTLSGNYLDVLARRESLRDPLLLDPPHDEDTPKERLKRKLSVNFGNRFAKQSKGSVSSVPYDVEGRELSMVLDEPVANYSSNTDIIKETPLNAGADEVDAMFVSLLQDTPAPIRDTAEEGADVESHDLTSAYSSMSSVSAPKISLSQLPPLGHPRKFISKKGSGPATKPVINVSKSPVAVHCLASPTVTPTGKLSSTETRKLQALDNQSSPIISELPAIVVNEVSEQSNVVSSSVAAPTDTTSMEAPLPVGWMQYFSNRENRHYWFNSNTGVSAWIRPS